MYIISNGFGDDVHIALFLFYFLIYNNTHMGTHTFLQRIANKAMMERGLATDFPQSVLQQLSGIKEPAKGSNAISDKRHLLWCSIDNDDSRDLDQLTFAEQNPDSSYTAYVAVADVDALVFQETPIDRHAQINTTSIYTAAKIFPMLPEKLSTNLTSLNPSQERFSIIFEIHFDKNMDLIKSIIYRALVYNYAKLTYSAVGAWLEEKGDMPALVSEKPGLAEVLRLQDTMAQKLKEKRQRQGALTFDTKETKAIFQEEQLVALEPTERNRAHELIENFMIAANTASARFALEHKIPGLRRVVRVPARWERIIELAKGLGTELPSSPDSKALDIFLLQQKKIHPETFPDLSLTIIKLLGSGEYVVEFPGESPIGHFGLALRDYTHSTAPNRRYPDLITQRLIKSVLQNRAIPYTSSELKMLADHCTHCEDLAGKVERQVKKSAAALLLEERIGETFNAIVTGSSEKGVWVRLIDLLIEGKLVYGGNNLDVGDHIQVKLIAVDVERGFIDFKRI